MSDTFGTPTGRNPDGSIAFGNDPQRNMSLVRFYKRRVLNQFKSEQAGAPQFDYKDFVEIIQAGDKSTTVDKEVVPDDTRVYAHQWQQYKAEQEQTPEGLPLVHLFPGNPEIVDTLKGYKFVTVEQLAAASDTAMQAVPMGGFEYREKARKYLEFSKDASKFLQIGKALEDKDSRIKQLEESVSVMLAKLQELGAAGPPAKTISLKARERD